MEIRYFKHSLNSQLHTNLTLFLIPNTIKRSKIEKYNFVSFEITKLILTSHIREAWPSQICFMSLVPNNFPIRCKLVHKTRLLSSIFAYSLR